MTREASVTILWARASQAAKRTGLRTRVVVGLVGLIVLTAAATGLPAYWLIHAELEQLAWQRLDQGAVTTQALLSSELADLGDLAALAGGRPTLQTMLLHPSDEGIDEYLASFAAGAELDLISVRDRSGLLVGGDRQLETPAELGQAPSRTIAIAGAGNDVALIASSPIRDRDGQWIGSVIVARWLDGERLERVRSQTGLENSLVVKGVRHVSTLPGAVGVAVDSASSQTGSTSGAILKAGGASYFVRSAPLGLPASGVAIETALSTAGSVGEERRILQLLGASTVIVAAVASAMGIGLSRSLARPLDQLTRAARRIARGDLSTPYPLPTDPPEVAVLAASLEESRAQTEKTLENLSRQKIWADALLDSIVEGIVTVGRSGTITSFSPGAERLMGWTGAEAIGQPAGVVFRTPGGTSFVDQLPPSGGRRPVEVLDRRGRTMTLSVTDARLRSPESGDGDLALVLRDVSEEEAVRHLRSYFLANISHEFRTPLSAINASVELLLEDVGSLTTAEIESLLHSVHLSVTGLQTLIDNLLESLSIEAGRFTLRRHAADIKDVVDGAVRIMLPLLDRREQALDLVVPPRLPPVWMDPMRVTQVIVNLLSNASKYSPVRQPIGLQVERAPGKRIRIVVRDRGEGIAPEDRENLFRRFVRLEPSDPGQYGIGIGLSVVKAIVDEHGGEIGVEPRPGGGSDFWFTLPIDRGSP
jgi:PAS domain S-box-containing protein